MNPDQFDSELKTYYRKIKSEIKQQHQEYIGKHPELREILNDFLSQVLLEKPQDVFDYSREYFSYFNIEEDKIKYKPIIICGPDGVGKSSVISTLIQKHPDLFQKSISYTTRAPLLSETHGVEYYFVSKNEFQKELEKDSFVESIQKNDGNYFGTHSGKLNAIVNSGKICILEIDVNGAQKVYKNNPDWKFIFLDEDLKICEQRMKDKKLDEQLIQEKLQTGQLQQEQLKQNQYFYKIKNTNKEETVNEIITYIKTNYANLEI